MQRYSFSFRKIQNLLLLLILLTSFIQASPALAGSGGQALQFKGTNQYVDLGNSSDLQLPTFTVETWFKRTGNGVGMNTGTGGLVGAIPLLTKGRSEGDGTGIDINYFLGISSTGYLAADFEEGATANQGLNHPLIGRTLLQNNIWYHAAASYDGSVFLLYLDGNLEASVTVNRVPATDGTQDAALASTLGTDGTSGGYFAGLIDEARIWKRVLNQTEVRDNRYRELTSGSGLVARWGLNDGSGNTAANSISGGTNGTLINNPLWVTGFLIPDSIAPLAPTGFVAQPFTSAASLSWVANTESDLAGYNIYRSTYSLVPLTSPINGSTLLSVTNYPDSGLTNGATYYYVITAVDTSGNESPASVTISATPLVSLGCGLALGSNQAYVNFGDPAKLDLSQFTIETWFKLTGAGMAGSTGSNGLTNAIPLLTHGASENDASNLDANWILAIDNTTGALAADFEDSTDGTNHPVIGITPITYNVWHHAAATYDGSTWRLYLDGNLEATLLVGFDVRSDSIQQVGLGVMLRSDGTPIGRFQGVLDEARVWNVARSEAQLLNTINSELTSSSGLVARWGFSECTGSIVIDSVANPANGTIISTGWSWVPGAPFNLALNHYPNQPVLVAPANGETGVSTSPTIIAGVSDPDSDNLTVSFYGRKNNSATITPFSIIVLPDTQYYSQNAPEMFTAQTQWIVDSRAARNIAYVIQLGDLVQNGGMYVQEWLDASAAMGLLESANIPYGVSLGNHDYDQAGNGDSSTVAFNQYFGTSRFLGRPYYGGFYGSNNDNHYDLFSASSIDFVVIYIAFKEPTPSVAVLDWADSVLKAYPNRYGIVMMHNLFPYVGLPAFSPAGQAVYDTLKDNFNLIMMLAGHVTAEVHRSDTYNGHTIYSILSDYQEGDNYGDGWLRMMEFRPVDNQISVSTFSPTRNGGAGDYQTDLNSQFSLPLNMLGSFSLLGTVNVPSGSNANLVWSGLQDNAEYEWYAVASDSKGSAQSATYQFTTGGGNTPPMADDQAVTTDEDIALNITLSASDPNLNPIAFDIVTTPVNGLLSGTAPNLTYTPNLNWSGTDTFTFKANDGMADSNIATVTITVNSVNDLPEFTSLPIATATEGSPYTYDITATDADTESILQFTAPTLPAWLTLVDNGDGTATLSGVPDNPDVGTILVVIQVSDGTANTLQTFNIIVGYGITPPSVTIDQAAAQSDPTTVAPIDFTVIFNEDVVGFSSASVLLSGTAGATTAAVTGSENYYHIFVSGMTSSGTVVVTIPAGVVTDVAGNPNLASTSTDNIVYYDFGVSIPPTVQIDLPSVSLTNTGPVSFPVTISGATVINLTVADITLNKTGTASGIVSITDETTATPTITLSGITGDGTIGISIGAGVAQDSAANPSAAAGPSTTFSVDNTSPTVVIGLPSSSTTNTNPVGFPVTISGATSVNLTSADVTLNTTGNATGTVTITNGGTANPVITVNGISGDGTIGISIAGGVAADLAGNGNASVGPSTTFVVDNTDPVVTISAPSLSQTSGNPVSFDLTITGADTINLTNADINLVTTGSATGSAAVTNGATANPTVTINGITGNGKIAISIASGVAQDTTGNANQPAGPSSTFIVDTDIPVVTIGAPSTTLTNSGPVTFPISVSGADTINLTVADVNLQTTGSVAATVTVSDGASANPTVTLLPISGDGTLNITIAAGVASDTVGNQSALAGPSTPVDVDNTTPQAVSITRVDASPTNAATVSFTVTFDSSVTGLSTANFELATTGISGASVSNITGSGTTYTVTVNTGSGDGTLGLNLVNSVGLSDAAGNPVGNAPFNGEVYTVIKTNPVVVSIARTDPNPTTATSVTFIATFSKSITCLTASNFALITTGVSGATISGITCTSNTATVVVNAGTGEGTVGLNLVNSTGVADSSGNPISNVPFTGEVYTIDLTAPVVILNGVNSVPDTGDGHIDELEIVTVAVTQITVNFNEDVNNPNGDSNPEDVTNPANYLLVRDNGDGIQTASCSAGVTGGDIVVTVDTVTYSNSSGNGPFVATLNINGGNSLSNGVYRLIVCGSTSITDLAGNELAGNGTIPQTDFLRNFVEASTTSSGGTGGNAQTDNKPNNFSGMPIPVTGFAPGMTTFLPLQPVDKTYTAYSGLVLEIPRLGVKMDIVGVPQTKSGWDVSWLARQAGYLDGSAFPTTVGNSVITAHVWDALNKPGPFYNLKTLSYGDKILIHAWGKIFTYEVQSQARISPSNIYTVMKRETSAWVTLVTCENYNSKTNDYAYRRIVRAVLVSVQAEK